MRRILLSTAAVAALAGQAFAADLPARTAPLAPVAPVTTPAPASTWGGLYVGAFAGGAFGADDFRQTSTGAKDEMSTSGFTAGGYVGVNYQVNKFVLGLEGEYGYQKLGGHKDFVSASTGATFYQSARTDQEGRIRARGGYVFNDLLFYAAGGVSFTGQKANLDLVSPATYNNVGNTAVGWNVGAGAEYAITKNWVGRFEYIYDQFGARNYGFGSLASQNFTDRKVRSDSSTVRLGVAYKFPIEGLASN
jgi:outer membrane immunogenic protein